MGIVIDMKGPETPGGTASGPLRPPGPGAECPGSQWERLDSVVAKVLKGLIVQHRSERFTSS